MFEAIIILINAVFQAPWSIVAVSTFSSSSANQSDTIYCAVYGFNERTTRALARVSVCACVCVRARACARARAIAFAEINFETLWFFAL